MMVPSSAGTQLSIQNKAEVVTSGCCHDCECKHMAVSRNCFFFATDDTT